MGLVTEVYADLPALNAAVEQVAADIAAKSPIAVTGTKRVMLKCRYGTTSLEVLSASWLTSRSMICIVH
jgi:enoyl-CoA hydratase